MTNEEAIDIIKSECYVFNPLNFDRSTMIDTALDMAVKALSVEPCEDAISRESAIRVFGDVHPMDYNTQVYIARIQYLPSVKPQYTEAEIQKIQELEQAQLEKAYEIGKAEQQRVGRWERTEYSPGLCNYHCSECHNISLDIGNYCPNCGAKMEEG